MVYVEISAIILLTLLNGVLALSELAIVSARKSRLEHLSTGGNRGARAALKTSR
jgi:putative hemolysin